MQRAEPSLSSFLHSNILMHHSMEKSMAFLLANKLASRTLLATQLVRLISEAYQADPVRPMLPSSVCIGVSVSPPPPGTSTAYGNCNSEQQEGRLMYVWY